MRATQLASSSPLDPQLPQLFCLSASLLVFEVNEDQEEELRGAEGEPFVVHSWWWCLVGWI